MKNQRKNKNLKIWLIRESNQTLILQIQPVLALRHNLFVQRAGAQDLWAVTNSETVTLKQRRPQYRVNVKPNLIYMPNTFSPNLNLNPILNPMLHPNNYKTSNTNFKPYNANCPHKDQQIN